MTEENRFHRAWLILVAMVLVYAGFMGITLNCIGVLFQAIRTDLGFRAGDLSLFYTIRSLTSSIVMPFTVSLFFKRSSRAVLGILGTVTCAGIAAMCWFDRLWQWYVAAVFMGVGSSCAMVVVPIVLNNWFHKRNGLAIGLAMAGSGVAGAIFSPVLSRMITTFGWRQAALLMALVSFLLIVPPTLALLVSSPEQKGLRPYGAGGETAADPSLRRQSVPPRGYIFILGLLAAVTANCLVQFTNQMATFAQTVGYTLEIGAILTSCCMVGNLLGKLLYGMLSDRVGIYHSARVYLMVVCASLAGFLFLSGNVFALYVSSALFGTCYSLSSMSASLLFLDLYGPEDYKAKLSRMQAVNGVIAAFLSAVIPYMYDITGSFNIVFVCGIATVALAFAVYSYLHVYSVRRSRTEEI